MRVTMVVSVLLLAACGEGLPNAVEVSRSVQALSVVDSPTPAAE